jgi:hypothetical protein
MGVSVALVVGVAVSQRKKQYVRKQCRINCSVAVVEAEADDLLREVKVAMIAVAVELRLTWDRKSIRGSSSITVEIAFCIAVENSYSSRKSSSSGTHRSTQQS